VGDSGVWRRRGDKVEVELPREDAARGVAWCSAKEKKEMIMKGD